MLWSTAFASAALLVSIGTWLGWRMPRSPVGWWLWGAGMAFAGWIAALYWPAAAGAWVALVLPSAFRILIALAVLGWPTGRFEPRWRRPLAWALTSYAALGVLSGFIGTLPGGAPPWGRVDWLLPSIGGPELGALRQAVVGIVFLVVAPTAFIVAVARRRNRLPRPLRSVATPAYAAAWVLVSADYWLFVSNVLAAQLELLDQGGTTVLGTVRAVVDYGRFGLVPVLLLVGYRARRRALRRVDAAPGVVDLGDHAARPPAPDAVAGLLGITGSRIVFSRPGGGWITADGRPAAPAGPELRPVPVADVDGRTIAVLEVPVDDHLAPTAVEAVAATIQVDLLRTRRMADAAARLAELRVLQRQVLDHQDAARRRLERDLHDGVQQQLVALTLEVALAERQERRGPGIHAPAARTALSRSIGEVADDVRQLVADERPAVLDGGLAGALAALASSVAVPTELALHGDLDADDPVAPPLFFAASEAVGNALKHAGADHLRIELWAGGDRVILSVTDDGCGGVTQVPAAIGRRITPTNGTVDLASPPGGGTAITINVPTPVRSVTP